MAQLTPSFFQLILRIEGGYQDLPTDSGNYCGGQLVGTKYGMSAVAMGEWLGRCPTVQEMKEFTQETAYNFYSWYFNRYRLFQVESQELFELLANNTMGSPAAAAKVEQRVLNAMGYQLAVDGVRGPATVAALNDAWRKRPTELYNNIRGAWIDYLRSLNRPEFLPGWLKRMESFPPIGNQVRLGAPVIIALLTLFLLRK